MYSVLLVSDSHGLTKELIEIKERHEVTNKIHCGDSELKETSPQLSSFTVVQGNCDWKGNFPEEEVIEVGGLRFYVTHGHLYGVKRSLLQLQYRTQEVEADVVCFGHSHVAYAEKIGEQLFINPGSIRTPKKFLERSYVVVEWTDRNDIHVNFYDLSGEVITSFPYPNQFILK